MDKYIRNGYVMIYMPNHHRAEDNGLVYEHVYLAEKYLGRRLNDGETVHHENRDRSNNSKDNLFVFKTNGDHVRYHHNGIMIKTDDGSYISPRLHSELGLCVVCDKEYPYNKNQHTGMYCSHECYNISQRRADRPSKDELLLLIKSKSFVDIGKDYGVSDNAVRKWCKSYDLPYRKKDIKNMFTSI